MSNLFSYFEECIHNRVALIGMCASILILVSMCFNTATRAGELKMRILNLLGSIATVVYGVLLGPTGVSVIFLNTVLVFVNGYYVFKNIYKNRKSKKNTKERQ